MKNGSQKISGKLIFFVLWSHAIFVFLLYYSNMGYISWKDRKPIVVHSILKPRNKPSIVNKRPLAASKVISPPVKKEEGPPAVVQEKPVPTSTKSKQKVSQKVPVKKVENSTSESRKREGRKRVVKEKKREKPSATKNWNREKEKLENLLEALEEESPSKVAFSSKKDTLAVPKPISELHVQAKLEVESAVNGEDSPLSIYQQRLIEELQANLHLPEYGEVKVRLQIGSSGKVVDAVIVEYKSEKNKKYLQNTLLELSFPWWDQLYTGNKDERFIITFRNE